jgi:asparagine synthase (glutamine-hydrolysing)
LRHGPTGVTITAHARLDNRDDLFQLLRIPSERQTAISDGELILEAYLRWGEECPEQLLGDWSFAAYDPRESKLVLARDQVGMNPMYYHAGDSTFSFSTSIKGLLALSRIPKRPNLFHVAKTLATWGPDGVETAYEHLVRLPAGHVLVVREGKLRLRRYWSPDPNRSVSLRSEDEYIEAFLELYGEAVRCRMRPPRTVGLTLSGGLDSGSVCALAAREMRQSGKNLNTFSSAPLFECTPKKGRFGDETPFIEANREFMGNLNVRYVRTENITPMAGIDRTLELLDDTVHGAGNMFWVFGILAAAREAGVGTLLTGASGNFTVSWNGDPVRTLRQNLRKHLLLSWAKPIQRQWQRRSRGGQDSWLAISPLNLQFVKSLDLGRRRKEDGLDPNFAPAARAGRMFGINLILRITQGYWNELGAGYGIEMADPTLDKRVVEFCLGIPAGIFQREGLDRRLVRLAMKNLLPDEVRLNRLRGLQAADLRLRLLSSSREVSDALDQIEGDPLSCEILNLAKMRRVFDELQHREDDEIVSEAFTVLMRGVMAGRFLCRF